MNNSEPSYEIIQPEGGLDLTPANQALVDQGFGSWTKPIDASVFLANGGTQEQLIYLWHHYPWSGTALDVQYTFRL